MLHVFMCSCYTFRSGMFGRYTYSYSEQASSHDLYDDTAFLSGGAEARPAAVVACGHVAGPRRSERLRTGCRERQRAHLCVRTGDTFPEVSKPSVGRNLSRDSMGAAGSSTARQGQVGELLKGREVFRDRAKGGPASPAESPPGTSSDPIRFAAEAATEATVDTLLMKLGNAIVNAVRDTGSNRDYGCLQIRCALQQRRGRPHLGRVLAPPTQRCTFDSRIPTASDPHALHVQESHRCGHHRARVTRGASAQSA